MPNMDKDVLFHGQLESGGNSSNNFFSKTNGNIRFCNLIDKYANEFVQSLFSDSISMGLVICHRSENIY